MFCIWAWVVLLVRCKVCMHWPIDLWLGFARKAALSERILMATLWFPVDQALNSENEHWFLVLTRKTNQPDVFLGGSSFLCLFLCFAGEGGGLKPPWSHRCVLVLPDHRTNGGKPSRRKGTSGNDSHRDNQKENEPHSRIGLLGEKENIVVWCSFWDSNKLLLIGAESGLNP